MTLAVMFRGVPPGPYVDEAIERVVQVDEHTRVTVLENELVGGPTVVFVHGLTSSASAPMTTGYGRALHQRGFRTVRLNQRNFGGTEHLSPTLSHAGLVDDLAAVVRDEVANHPGRPIYLAGFSMGGNVVLRYLGLGLAPDEVQGAATTSAAVDLGAAAKSLPWIYDRYFVRELTAMYCRKASLYPERYQPEDMAGVRTVRGFDAAAVVPCFGFADVDDYYTRASSLPVLHRIDRPCLLLVSDDDPIVPVSSFDDPVFEGAQFTVERTRFGGHVGWIGPGPTYWAEAFLADWLARLASD